MVRTLQTLPPIVPQWGVVLSSANIAARGHNRKSRLSIGLEARKCGSTHVLGERKTPALFIPRQLSDAFHLDGELSLKVQELVQTREQEMERVPVEVGHCLVTVFL